MNSKPGKSPAEDSKNANRRVDSDHAIDEAVTRDTPHPVREGPENLRQRSEWFRHRRDEK
jgi:hypothetical protein